MCHSFTCGLMTNVQFSFINISFTIYIYQQRSTTTDCNNELQQRITRITRIESTYLLLRYTAADATRRVPTFFHSHYTLTTEMPDYEYFIVVYARVSSVGRGYSSSFLTNENFIGLGATGGDARPPSVSPGLWDFCPDAWDFSPKRWEVFN